MVIVMGFDWDTLWSFNSLLWTMDEHGPLISIDIIQFDDLGLFEDREIPWLISKLPQGSRGYASFPIGM